MVVPFGLGLRGGHRSDRRSSPPEAGGDSDGASPPCHWLAGRVREKQQDYLVEIGLLDRARPIDEKANIDELGLEFEDANYLVSGLARTRQLTDRAVDHIARLNDFLMRQSGSGNRGFWTIRALNEDGRWAEHGRSLGNA